MWGTTSPLFNGYQGLFPRRDFDHYPPSSVKFEKEWSYTTMCHMCLRGMGRENVIFYKLVSWSKQ